MHLPARLTLFPLILLILSQGALAHQEDKEASNRISLSAEARGDLKNNLLRVVFFTQAEHKSASEAASQVNTTMQKVKQRLEGEDDLKQQSLAYQTTPVYDNRVIVAWRVRQSLMLESEKTAYLADWMGKLQDTLSVESVTFDVTDESRREKEDELIRQALGHFSDRARLVQRQMGADDYQLINLDISTQGQSLPIRAMARSTMAVMDEAATPSLEAGEQTVTVRVHGFIELHD